MQNLDKYVINLCCAISAEDFFSKNKFAIKRQVSPDFGQSSLAGWLRFSPASITSVGHQHISLAALFDKQRISSVQFYESERPSPNTGRESLQCRIL